MLVTDLKTVAGAPQSSTTSLYTLANVAVKKLGSGEVDESLAERGDLF